MRGAFELPAGEPRRGRGQRPARDLRHERGAGRATARSSSTSSTAPGPGRAQPPRPRRRAQPGRRRHPDLPRRRRRAGATPRVGRRRTGRERELSALGRTLDAVPADAAGTAPGHLRPQRRGRAGRPARLLRDRVGVRAHDLRARDRGPDGRPTLAFTPDFHLPGVRLLPRGHHARPALVTRKNRKVRLLRELSPRDRRPHHLPAGLPPPDREVRPRPARAARRPAAAAAGRGCASRPPRRWACWVSAPVRAETPGRRRPARLAARARALTARRRAPCPRGEDGALRRVGDAAVVPGRHAGRAPGLPDRRGRVRRQPPRHRAGGGAGRLRAPAGRRSPPTWPRSPGPDAVHAPARRGRRLGARRHHRLVGVGRAVRRDAERVEHRRGSSTPSAAST